MNKVITLLNNNQKYFEDFISRMTYHSNAIEGSTLTFAETYAILFENNKTKINAIPREVFEAINHKQAIDFVLKEIENNNNDLTNDFIIEIARIINNNIQYIGGYRLYPIRIIGSDEKFPHPQVVELLMDELIINYNQVFANGVNYKDLAKFHIDFESIHPFSDGNGRTGRLLINYQLIKHDYYPLIISINDRTDYLNIMKNKDVDKLASLLEVSANIEKERIEDFIEMQKELDINNVLK